MQDSKEDSQDTLLLKEAVQGTTGEGLRLREIARLAKVSTATASRAINRVPTVNPMSTTLRLI